MYKHLLLIVLFLSKAVWSIQIAESKTSAHGTHVTFSHLPSSEKIGAFKVTIRINNKLPVASISTDAPNGGAWSQVKPELTRKENDIEIMCVGPAMLNSRITTTLEMFHIDFDITGKNPDGSNAGRIIDSIWFNECYDIQGNAITPVIDRTTATFKPENRAVSLAEKVKCRSAGRIHTLTFNLGGAEKVKAWVVDIKGRMVTQLVDKTMNPGLHTVKWPLKNQAISTGTYFIQVEINNYTYNKRVSYYR